MWLGAAGEGLCEGKTSMTGFMLRGSQVRSWRVNYGKDRAMEREDQAWCSTHRKEETGSERGSLRSYRAVEAKTGICISF